MKLHAENQRSKQYNYLQPNFKPSHRMLMYDISFLLAAALSFFLSIYLWFGGSKDQGLFVGIWVPSIISLGIYGRLIFGGPKQ